MAECGMTDDGLCGMNHDGLCGLQSSDILRLQCNGTDKCPVFRKMLALERLSSREAWRDGNVTYTFEGSN